MSFFKSIGKFFGLQFNTQSDTPAEKEDLEPNAEFVFVDGKLKIKNFNGAFVDELKSKLGDLSDGKTDAQLVELYLDRENLEREEPKLEVIHLGLKEDGTASMKLDWNRAFINHLRENGIEAETEDMAIEMYLQLLQRKVDLDLNHEENADNAFADIDAELGQEFEAARKLAEQKKKPRRGGRKQRNIAPPEMPDSF
jgi:hypothetical protein